MPTPTYRGLIRLIIVVGICFTIWSTTTTATSTYEEQDDDYYNDDTTTFVDNNPTKDDYDDALSSPPPDNDNNDPPPTPTELQESMIQQLNSYNRYRLFDIFRDALHYALQNTPTDECMDSRGSHALLETEYPHFDSFQNLPEDSLRRFVLDFITSHNITSKLFHIGGGVKRRSQWSMGNAQMDLPEYLTSALARARIDVVDGAKAFCELWHTYGERDLLSIIETFELLVFDDRFISAFHHHTDCFPSFYASTGKFFAASSQADEVMDMLTGHPPHLISYILSLSAGMHLSGLQQHTPTAPLRFALAKAQLAAQMDDPLAHSILARHFGMNRTVDYDPIQHYGASWHFPLDCERSMGHLGAMASLVLSFVQDQVRGGNIGPGRLSTVTEDGVGEYIAYTNAAEFDIEVAHWIHQINEFNEPFDMLAVGEMLYYGAPHIGVPGRPQQAAGLFRRAAHLGNGPAATHVAHMIHDGEIENPDQTKSINETAYGFYEIAAKAGEPSGYVGMAYFHQYGGIPSGINLTEAMRLYDMAAKLNYSDADYRAGHLLLTSGGNTPNSTAILLRWQRAADAGHVVAALEAGYMYFADYFDRDSCRKASDLFLKVTRADWARRLNFESSKAYYAFLQGREVDALKMFLVSSTILWEPEATMNAAWLLEFGKPKALIDEVVARARAMVPQSTTCRNPTQPPSRSLSTIETIWLMLRDVGRALFRGFGMIRESCMEDVTRIGTSLWVQELYGDATLDGSSGAATAEAWRRLADYHATPGMMGCYYDELLAVYFYRRAADLQDAQAIWTLAILRQQGFGNMTPNATQSKMDLKRIYNLDWGGVIAAWLAEWWIDFQ